MTDTVVEAPESAGSAGQSAVSATSRPTASEGSVKTPEDFATALERVQEAARDWGIRPDLMEGRFVSALLNAVSWTGRISESAQAEFRQLFQKQRDQAEVELARAREITRAANAALGQARNAMISLQVERENVVVRMIHETMPMFAKELRGALVIREKALNDGVRLRRFLIAAMVTLGVFLGGYTVRAFADADAVGELGRCMAHPLQAQGRLYCDVTRFGAANQ